MGKNKKKNLVSKEETHLATTLIDISECNTLDSSLANDKINANMKRKIKRKQCTTYNLAKEEDYYPSFKVGSQNEENDSVEEEQQKFMKVTSSPKHGIALPGLIPGKAKSPNLMLELSGALNKRISPSASKNHTKTNDKETNDNFLKNNSTLIPSDETSGIKVEDTIKDDKLPVLNINSDILLNFNNKNDNSNETNVDSNNKYLEIQKTNTKNDYDSNNLPGTIKNAGETVETDLCITKVSNSSNNTYIVENDPHKSDEKNSACSVKNNIQLTESPLSELIFDQKSSLESDIKLHNTDVKAVINTIESSHILSELVDNENVKVETEIPISGAKEMQSNIVNNSDILQVKDSLVQPPQVEEDLIREHNISSPLDYSSNTSVSDDSYIQSPINDSSIHVNTNNYEIQAIDVKISVDNNMEKKISTINAFKTELKVIHNDLTVGKNVVKEEDSLFIEQSYTNEINSGENSSILEPVVEINSNKQQLFITNSDISQIQPIENDSVMENINHQSQHTHTIHGPVNEIDSPLNLIHQQQQNNKNMDNHKYREKIIDGKEDAITKELSEKENSIHDNFLKLNSNSSKSNNQSHKEENNQAKHSMSNSFGSSNLYAQFSECEPSDDDYSNLQSNQEKYIQVHIGKGYTMDGLKINSELLSSCSKAKFEASIQEIRNQNNIQNDLLMRSDNLIKSFIRSDCDQYCSGVISEIEAIQKEKTISYLQEKKAIFNATELLLQGIQLKLSRKINDNDKNHDDDIIKQILIIVNHRMNLVEKTQDIIVNLKKINNVSNQ